jgi:hypothetical protein
MSLDALIDSMPAGPGLTAALDMPRLAGQVSAVIATSNRCPFDPARGRLRDNPLTWALDSLLTQAGHVLAEIVVADDGSTDHTQAVLGTYLSRPGRVPVRAVRLPRHRGAWAARNAAAGAARSRWLLFGDDDCVFAPHYAAGAAYVMDRLRERDPAAAAVMLPFYYRATRPRQTAPSQQIGRLNPDLAHFATQFHTWPLEYLPAPPRLDQSGLTSPIRVELIGGTALLDARALHAAGGFTDLSAWPASYSDHLHLSADLTDADGHLYHCPDPRLAAIHLKFGAAGRYQLSDADLQTCLPGVGRSLGELVDLAATPRSGTGCRVTDSDFHAEMIGSFFAFFARRSARGAITWGIRTWQEFVENGQVYSLAVASVPSRHARESSWRSGLSRAGRVLSTSARPQADTGQVDRLLSRVCQAVGQPPVTCW